MGNDLCCLLSFVKSVHCHLPGLEDVSPTLNQSEYIVILLLLSMLSPSPMERPILPSVANQDTAWIEKLPQEMTNRICYFADDKTSKNLRLVSKRFQDSAAVNVSIPTPFLD